MTSHPSALITTVRDELRSRQAARASRKTLERELAYYTSPGDLNELYAIMSRHREDEIAPLHDILSRRRAA